MPQLIGFIGDIHGDLEALEWALSATAGADLRVSLGDVVDGPHDSDCIRLLQGKSVVVVQGNHDAWASREERHDAEERQWLGTLPRTFEGDDWLAYHSQFDFHPGEEWPVWVYLTKVRDIERTFAAWPQRVLFCGHNHMASVNVLTQGQLSYVPTDQLKREPLLRLQDGKRYLVCADRPTDCVVLYRQDESIEFVFRPQK